MSVSGMPIGATENTLKPDRPAWRRSSLETRNDGAPRIVIVVPRELAMAIGIRSLEAGISRSRARASVIGSMTAVMVTWWVKAEASATAGMITASMRAMLAPASLPIQRPAKSETPVFCSPALRTNMQAMTTAGSLLRPESASSVDRVWL
jgi:hypothetical protein